MSISKKRRFLGGCIALLCLFAFVFQLLAYGSPVIKAAGTHNPDYLAYANAGAQVLQNWYDSSNGQFDSTGWWNSANALGAIIDYSRLTGNTVYTGDIANSFNVNSSGNFLGSYYDDEGWWALTWVDAYDYTGNTTYLNMAKTIFTNISSAWDTTCSGGVWWSTSRTYKNAITNELFFTLATRLHERTPGDTSYLNWATQEWNWFSQSGLINSSNLINDGLSSSCANNGGTTWTYNQGVILGGLTDMYKITGNTSYLGTAEKIANAAISTLVTSGGILREPCEASSSCGGDGPQFKGIFMRNLSYLYQADHNQPYANFLAANASSIWANDRNSSNQFGLVWSGPFDSADAARQSSAQDALNSAIAFSNVSSGTSLTNVALNKAATANGSCTSSEVASKAVDGSVVNDSKWCAGATSGQYWLLVDLGTQYDIASFTVMHAGAGGEETDWNTQAFTIQVSNDAANWTTVVNVANNTASVTTHPVATTMARYIKLVITVPQTSSQFIAARIYEFQAYAFSGGSSVDLAWNKTASADSTCSSAEVASKAVDRSIVNDSKWCSGGTGGQYWLLIDLGTTRTIGRFVIDHAGAGGESSSYDTRDFTLQLSTDNVNWTTVVSVTGNTSDVTTHTITATQARYVKLVITNPQTSTQFIAARIYELEVFSN